MKLRSSTITVAVSLLALSLTSCQRETPASVCAADETLDMVRYLTVDLILQNENDVDHPTWETAFDEFASFEFVTLEGYDRDTKRISCKVNVTTPTSNAHNLYVEYFRQPEAGTGDHVYEISLGGDVESGWRRLIHEVDRRYRQLSRFEQADSEVAPHPAANQNDGREATSSAPPPPTAGAGSFPVSYRGPSATITGLVGVDSEAAMMTGAVTARDAESECALENYQVDIQFERCVERVMSEHRAEFVVTANCRTGDLLALDGAPYRRITTNGQIRWRNETTERFVNEDAMVEGANTLHAQFRRLCPATVGGAG